MRQQRILVPCSAEVSGGAVPPVAIYHIVARVVDHSFKLKDAEREHFRMLLRMYERFSGCRIWTYCLMSNNIHVMLEVPPGCGRGESLELTDEELLWRLGGLYSKGAVARVEKEIFQARQLLAGKIDRGEGAAGIEEYEPEAQAQMIKAAKEEGARQLAGIHARYGYRMHSLPEFFKGLLQRFTCWYNRENGRCGTLWESRFRSTVVQDGLAARTVAAYIDLNPVRAGMVGDPADYRWNSYGEAVGGGRGAKKAQEGLVRALSGFSKEGPKVMAWAQGGLSKSYRKILITAAMEMGEERGNVEEKKRVVTRKGMARGKAKAELTRLDQENARDMRISKVVGCRVRYFTEGGVIGSKQFVNDLFQWQRGLFSEKRKDGARKPRGALNEMAGEIWAIRDLQE